MPVMMVSFAVMDSCVMNTRATSPKFLDLASNVWPSGAVILQCSRKCPLVPALKFAYKNLEWKKITFRAYLKI